MTAVCKHRQRTTCICMIELPDLNAYPGQQRIALSCLIRTRQNRAGRFEAHYPCRGCEGLQSGT